MDFKGKSLDVAMVTTKMLPEIGTIKSREKMPFTDFTCTTVDLYIFFYTVYKVSPIGALADQ